MPAKPKKKAAKPRGGNIVHKWDDSYWFVIYEHARHGMRPQQIAQAMGLHIKVLKRFVKERPALREAIESVSGAGRGTDVTGETFIDYVHKRLSPDLREIWDRLCEWESDGSFERRAEAMLAQKGKRVRQQLYVHALVVSNFNSSEALRRVNISKTTLEKWIREDEDFPRLLDEIKWHKQNFVEGSLMNLVAEGDTAAVIYSSKVVNRDRGYDPKTNLDLSINDMTSAREMDELDLPLEARRAIVDAMRKRALLQSGRAVIVDSVPAIENAKAGK